MAKKEDCYYKEYDCCTCTMSKNCDKYCIGEDNCDNYIAQSEYFNRLMSGEIKESAPREDKVARQQRINKNLSLGPTKKQQKYQARQAAERERLKDEANGLTGGVSLMDDPRFKDLFGKK